MLNPTPTRLMKRELLSRPRNPRVAAAALAVFLASTLFWLGCGFLLRSRAQYNWDYQWGLFQLASLQTFALCLLTPLLVACSRPKEGEDGSPKPPRMTLLAPLAAGMLAGPLPLAAGLAPDGKLLLALTLAWLVVVEALLLSHAFSLLMSTYVRSLAPALLLSLGLLQAMALLLPLGVAFWADIYMSHSESGHNALLERGLTLGLTLWPSPPIAAATALGTMGVGPWPAMQAAINSLICLALAGWLYRSTFRAYARREMRDR